MTRRTGRRPGNPGTREAILDAARTAFAERGYDAASIRGIAGTAQVDPALVHHYFGSKDQLFLAAMNFPVDPGQLVPKVLAGDRDGVGERMVRIFLGVWDSPTGSAAQALLRSAVSNEWTARLLREFVTTQVLRRVLENLDVDPVELPLRGSLVATQMIGLAMMRHVVRLEPVASADPETLVAAIGPTIQRYLTGPLPS
ncbi:MULTISPECIES: TetR family transcriptional regulator [Micromonospora]|uniref:TetR/AcrR family transcriptional regulator n=1 Tax=Micromonospora TaxID=1873 RepID=UPI001EE85AE8|nr:MULTISPECIES: TetR family transcriptional regulator [Micromonospora]MCG5451708.1 TetR family transcriptional regulator [Micromonospora hortensis]MCX5121422.1 TetR family transcriptional regulator [Micromonospora sp. NBC_00362]WTI06616.1 TetR family transcriptional regulator [Micromonospora sp. NBC_00821]